MCGVLLVGPVEINIVAQTILDSIAFLMNFAYLIYFFKLLSIFSYFFLHTLAILHQIYLTFHLSISVDMVCGDVLFTKLITIYQKPGNGL